MVDNSKVVGDVSWDDFANQEENKTKASKKIKGLSYLNMKFPGDYPIRIVQDKPTPYYCHWVDAKIKDEMGNVITKRKKVNCTQDSDCPICIKPPNQGPERKFYVKVLDRTTGTLKILDCGLQIVGAIAKLKQKEDWGDPRGYDITINKGQKGANPLYTVTPSPKKKLTDEELGMIEESDTEGSETYVDFKKLQSPWPAERIKAILKGEMYRPNKKEEEEEEDGEDDTFNNESVDEVAPDIVDEDIDLGDEEFMEVEE